jgi:hypothetical protein
MISQQTIIKYSIVIHYHSIRLKRRNKYFKIKVRKSRTKLQQKQKQKQQHQQQQKIREHTKITSQHTTSNKVEVKVNEIHKYFVILTRL